MKKEESKREAIFPVSVIEIDRSDIECAVCSFEEDIQEVLSGITWDEAILSKIVTELHRELKMVYYDNLPYAIKDALKDEIEEMKVKRGFLNGLKRIVKERGKKKR